MAFTKQLSPGNWLVRTASKTRCTVKVEVHMTDNDAEKLIAWEEKKTADLNRRAGLPETPEDFVTLGSAILSKLTGE